MKRKNGERPDEPNTALRENVSVSQGYGGDTESTASILGKAKKRFGFKKILFPVAAMVLGLMAALVLVEIIFRIFQIKPVRYLPVQTLAWDGTVFRQTTNLEDRLIKIPGPFIGNGVRAGEYVPGAAFKLVFEDNPRGYFDNSNAVLATINSLGLRGKEVAPQKPAGIYRILGIGDSFAFGEGVKDEDTFLHRLQLQLNTRTAGKNFEVLNAGVQGYNTRDEVLYLEHRWLKLEPDLVLITFYVNDAYKDTTILNNGSELGIYQKQPPGLAQYSYLWDLAQHRYQTHRVTKTVEAFYRRQYFSDFENFVKDPGPFNVDWPVCDAALGRVAQLARERGFRVGLVMFPELYELDGDYPFSAIHKLVREACARRNIPFLDLFDTFRGRKPESLWVHPSNHHPNEIAHALAATAVEVFVREKFLKSERRGENAAHR